MNNAHFYNNWLALEAIATAGLKRVGGKTTTQTLCTG